MALVAALGLGLATGARGQEAIRISVAGSEAAEARHKAATTAGYYNLKLGPTAWNFSAGLLLEYDSNIYLVQDNPKGDLIFRPQFNAQMLWPVSDLNSINLTLGAGYSIYAQNSELDRPFILPNTGLSFDLYVGDFWINLHDRFSITENNYQDPTVSGSGSYSQFQNALGVTTVWDLNKGVVNAGYDHVDYHELNLGTGQNSSVYPSSDSEVFSASAGYTLKPGMLLGPELGASLITYTSTTTGTTYPKATEWNAGAFYNTQMSEHIHCILHTGYALYSPESSGTSTTSGDQGGVYAQLDFTHRVNQHLTYSLSGGRTTSLVYAGGTMDRYFVNLQANWQILPRWTLGSSFAYQYDSGLYTGSQTYSQYGPGISLNRVITAKLSTAKLSSSLDYQIYWRDSNTAAGNYVVNVVSLNLNYKF